MTAFLGFELRISDFIRISTFDIRVYSSALQLAVRPLSGLIPLRMSTAYQIVVCGSIVPDPLQTLEPVTGPAGPSLKNELMLPAVLDPWAGHALYEAANLAQKNPGSKVYLV